MPEAAISCRSSSAPSSISAGRQAGGCKQAAIAGGGVQAGRGCRAVGNASDAGRHGTHAQDGSQHGQRCMAAGGCSRARRGTGACSRTHCALGRSPPAPGVSSAAPGTGAQDRSCQGPGPAQPSEAPPAALRRATAAATPGLPEAGSGGWGVLSRGLHRQQLPWLQTACRAPPSPPALPSAAAVQAPLVQGNAMPQLSSRLAVQAGTHLVMLGKCLRPAACQLCSC